MYKPVIIYSVAGWAFGCTVAAILQTLLVTEQPANLLFAILTTWVVIAIWSRIKRYNGVLERFYGDSWFLLSIAVHTMYPAAAPLARSAKLLAIQALLHLAAGDLRLFMIPHVHHRCLWMVLLITLTLSWILPIIPVVIGVVMEFVLLQQYTRGLGVHIGNVYLGDNARIVLGTLLATQLLG